MVCKKVSIKKSAGTMTGLVITLLLTIGMFMIGFLYLKSQTDADNIQIPERYNDTFVRLDNASKSMDKQINEIQSNVGNISEASTIYAVAWNGLKGLGNTLVLMISFINNGVGVAHSFFISMDIIPQIIVLLATTGIIAFVVFLVISVLKGDPRM